MDPIAALRRLIEHLTRDRVFLRNYEAVVQRQHADGALDLLPDDETVRGTGLSGVPIRHGFPGLSCKVVIGTRCLLGFIDGDPTKPFAHGFTSNSLQSLSIKALESVTIETTLGKVEVSASGEISLNRASVSLLGDVTAMGLLGPVSLSTHIHSASTGPTSPPTPGT